MVSMAAFSFVCLFVCFALIFLSSDVDQSVSYEALYTNCSLLNQRNVTTRECESRDRLTELYLQHVIPLPQRTLPNSRWGKRMEKSRERRTPAGHRSGRSLITIHWRNSTYTGQPFKGQLVIQMFRAADPDDQCTK